MERGIITIRETGAVTIPAAPVWMTLQEISDLFGIFSCHVRKALRTIYKNKELDEPSTMKYVRQPDGISYDVYSMEAVIAVAFRLATPECLSFRRFVMDKLKGRQADRNIQLIIGYGKGGTMATVN